MKDRTIKRSKVLCVTRRDERGGMTLNGRRSGLKKVHRYMTAMDLRAIT